MKEQDKQRNDRITNRLTFSAVFKRSKYILDFLQIFEMKNKSIKINSPILLMDQSYILVKY